MKVWDHLKSKYPNDSPEEAFNYLTGNAGKKDGNNGEGSKYYLATQLTVLSGQPFTGSMPSTATREMVKIARRSPRENYAMIMREGVSSLRLHETNPQKLLANLGIRISANMVRVPARQISALPVQYAGRLLNATSGSWDFGHGSHQYLASANRFNDGQATARVVHFYPDGVYLRRDNLMSYARNLEHEWALYHPQGMQPATNDSFISVRDWNLKPLVNLLQQRPGKDGSINSRKFDLAVVIFPKDDVTQRKNYSNFRIAADQILGLPSICMNQAKIIGSLNQFRLGQDKINNDTLKDHMRNISMKLNLRLGNTNHSIQKAALGVIGGDRDTCDTMILGADVTHPGAGSVPFAPSIAAVVGSIDNYFSQCPGSMRLNPARQKWIKHMKAMTMERLRLGSEKNNSLPKRILYYRDGVGDSYLAKIRNTEVSAIETAWKDLGAEKIGDAELEPVKVTAVVVTKRHHTRLYPLNLNGNCPPGTVVDSGITHSYFFDFYLQSHNLRQGTAKPSHYMVIKNDMDLTPQQLQDLTYHLCYTYGRSANAVSYAPQAYYADRLCERGRLYLKPFYDQSQEIKAVVNAKENDKKAAEKAVMIEAAKAFYRAKPGEIIMPKNPWHENLDD